MVARWIVIAVALIAGAGCGETGDPANGTRNPRERAMADGWSLPASR